VSEAGCAPARKIDGAERGIPVFELTILALLILFWLVEWLAEPVNADLK
jgi:hypothetical protein